MQNSNGGISEFWISGFLISGSLIKENCHNFLTSDGIDMKFRPVMKLHKKDETTSETFNDDVISKYCYVIVIFPINGQFGGI